MLVLLCTQDRIRQKTKVGERFSSSTFAYKTFLLNRFCANIRQQKNEFEQHLTHFASHFALKTLKVIHLYTVFKLIVCHPVDLYSSTHPNFHELLLATLWSCVVHESPLVRSATAKVFGSLVKGINEALVSSRVVPALITLSGDQDM